MDDVAIETADLKKVVSENVIRYRDAKGWSQEQLAEKVGVHRVQISRIENAHALPSVELLYALADRFGVTADELRKISVTPLDMNVAD